MGRLRFSASEGYGWTCLSPVELKKNINRCVRQFGILNEKLKADAIAYSGSSGSVLAFAIAFKYNLPVIYLRKQGEESHGSRVEFNGEDATRYLIVDDFIDSGETVKYIISAVKHRCTGKNMRNPKCVGVLLYDPCGKDIPEGRNFGKTKVPVFAPNMEDEDE